MIQMLPENWFVRDTKLNAVISWVLTGMLAVTIAVGLVNSRFDIVMLAGAAAIVAVVPPLVSRNWQQSVPWPLLLVATFPLVFGASGSFFGLVIVGIGIAALALLVVVVLQMTTTVRMTPNFATGFVMICTLGTAGLWAVLSATSARFLGSAFVETNDQLMGVFSAALVASILSGLIFRWYFRRQLERNRSSGSPEEAQIA